jgi:hypothetical protein
VSDTHKQTHDSAGKKYEELHPVERGNEKSRSTGPTAP